MVVASTAAPAYVVPLDIVRKAVRRRRRKPMFMLDLAVPRDVDPGCGDVAGVHLADVTDVRAEVDEGAVGEHVAAGRAIVAEEAEAFASWMRSRRVTPTISSLRARGEQVRHDEMERVEPRLAELSDRERAAVEKLTKGIVNTLLHEPTVRLKALADGHGAEWHAQVISDLFGLEPDEPQPDGAGDAGEAGDAGKAGRAGEAGRASDAGAG